MKKLMSIVFLVCISRICSAQNEVEFLKQYAKEISIDPTNSNYEDLAALKQSIGTSKIVMLGEETHGDGKTFETKARLVKFLHEEMGFNVLAFESSMYNAERGYSMARFSKTPISSIQNSMFELWGHTQQFYNLATYISTAIKSDNPLRLTGFDCQLHGAFLRKDLPVDFLFFLRANKISFKDSTEQDTFFKVYSTLVYDMRGDDAARMKIAHSLPTFRKILDEKITQLGQLSENNQAALWKQFWISARAYLPVMLKKQEIEFREIPNEQFIRDSLMAENLSWLIKHRYPNEKIIVWAASYHMGSGGNDKRSWVLGDYLKEQFGDRIYSICFTAYNGEFARYFDKDPINIADAAPGSFEDLFQKAGFENACLDLKMLARQSDGSWLNEARSMRPFGYVGMSRQWPRIFDMVIFNKMMNRALPFKF